MPNTRASKNKISGSEILSDSDDDSYQIPPAAFATVKMSLTTILTRSAKRIKPSSSVPQTKVTYETSPLHNPELEMVIFQAIKSQLMINACVKSSKNKINPIGTFVPVSSHFSKPNFHQKPKKRSKTTTYTSSVARVN